MKLELVNANRYKNGNRNYICLSYKPIEKKLKVLSLDKLEKEVKKRRKSK